MCVFIFMHAQLVLSNLVYLIRQLLQTVHEKFAADSLIQANVWRTR